MTVDQIVSEVTRISKDYDFGKNDTKLLVRYFVYKYCCWMTQRSIGRMFDVTVPRVCEGIKNIEKRSEYAFIKLRIHDVMKQKIK